MSKGDKNIWDLAIDKNKQAEAEESQSEEAAVLFVGSKSAGKTSIVLRFLDRDEPPKPTIALEYTFGRRARGHNIMSAKDVGHIWELGGGTWLSKLIDVPINADAFGKISIALVLDLSKPEGLWFTLETMLTAIKARINAIVSELRIDNPGIKDELKKKAWERLGADHLDKDMMDPLLVPFVIIGAKYDLFQDFDSEKKKVICKTLRFVAHTHGAHLQFFSTKQDALVNRSRSLISHLLFNTAASKSTQFEHHKPLLVPAGSDSLQNIGSPPLADGDIGRVTARNPLELWKQAYVSFFPQESENDPALVEDPAKDPQYKESDVDSMRAQKDEELERYRRLSERRMKEEQQRAMAEGYA